MDENNTQDAPTEGNNAGLAGDDAAWNRANEMLVYNLTMTLQLALEKLGAPAETLSAQEDGDIEHIHDWLDKLPPGYAAAPTMRTALLRAAECFDAGRDVYASGDVAAQIRTAIAMVTEPANEAR